MVLLYFNFEIEDKTPHKDGPTWPPGHWFHFPIFQIKIFGVSKRWVLSVSLQLELRHPASTLQIISLNISLFTSQCNADLGNRTLLQFELKIPFCTFKGLPFTRTFHPWDICVYKDKSSVLNKAHLQLPFLLLLQIIAIFPDYENNIYFLSCFVPWYTHLGAYFMIMLLLCESNRKVVPLSETFNHKLTKF